MMFCSDDLITFEMQKKELQMLKSLSVILKECNIDFYLACGSALGCKRHEGFIPWDDDIDIYILGKDYPRLKEKFENGKIGNLELHDFESVHDYPYVFPKIVASDTVLVEDGLNHLQYRSGVYIDIFPLQVLDDKLLIRFFCELNRYFRYCLLNLYYHKQKTAIRKMLACVVKKIVKPKRIQKSLYRRMIVNRPSQYLVEPLMFFSRSKIKREYFQTKEIACFEDIKMPVPYNCDGYLTDYFGEYKQLPPKEQQKSNHSFSVLSIDGKKYI